MGNLITSVGQVYLTMSIRPVVPKIGNVPGFTPIIPGLPGNTPATPKRNITERGPDIREVLPTEPTEGFYWGPPVETQQEFINRIRSHFERPYSKDEFDRRLKESQEEWNRRYGGWITSARFWWTVAKDILNPTYGIWIPESPISVDEPPPPRRDPVPGYPPPKPPGYPPDLFDIPDDPPKRRDEACQLSEDLSIPYLCDGHASTFQISSPKNKLGSRQAGRAPGYRYNFSKARSRNQPYGPRRYISRLRQPPYGRPTRMYRSTRRVRRIRRYRRSGLSALF